MIVVIHFVFTQCNIMINILTLEVPRHLWGPHKLGGIWAGVHTTLGGHQSPWSNPGVQPKKKYTGVDQFGRPHEWGVSLNSYYPWSRKLKIERKKIKC
ncbi:unnamed protein product, partial [Mesorhabditis belari]|uniref:Uncharacterized protein n=1 Tax=Mesorhabditis belari TaxID=2138241 RepID=A0AAF3EVW0_9BILA